MSKTKNFNSQINSRKNTHNIKSAKNTNIKEIEKEHLLSSGNLNTNSTGSNTNKDFAISPEKMKSQIKTNPQDGIICNTISNNVNNNSNGLNKNNLTNINNNNISSKVKVGKKSINHNLPKKSIKEIYKNIFFNKKNGSKDKFKPNTINNHNNNNVNKKTEPSCLLLNQLNKNDHSSRNTHSNNNLNNNNIVINLNILKPKIIVDEEKNNSKRQKFFSLFETYNSGNSSKQNITTVGNKNKNKSTGSKGRIYSIGGGLSTSRIPAKIKKRKSSCKQIGGSDYGKSAKITK